MFKRMVLATVIVMVFLAAAEADEIGALPVGGQGKLPLHGIYSITGTRACVYTSQDGFGPPPGYALLFPGSSRTAIVAGELRLEAGGTGEADFRLMQINHILTGPGQQPMSVALSSCGVSHGDLPDGTRVLNTIGCRGPVIEGGGAGGFATGGESSLFVTSTRNGSVLLLSDTEPVVEAVTFSPSPGVEFPSIRICSRSYSAIRVSPIQGE